MRDQPHGHRDRGHRWQNAFDQRLCVPDFLDTVGVTTFAGCKDALSERGTYLPLNSGFREIAQALFTPRSGGKKVKFAISENTREGLEQVLALIESGALRPVVDQVYPMDRIAEAHRHVESRHKRGAVIVSMARAG